ncbi:hypothetical protein GJR96_01295 [Haloferax sp. MBLA0076]|uniref:Uncharacterized protein n=1 Tax=Haloferax litoreum TaxID=2666140 RepID=A0A6A8GCY4_9EURY|nr:MULTISPECIES: hypothetical protein [Haloferax]KAB1192148.1 hypothetical protein Hfx1148_01295 [Haloferax sp. CBA1148]MRX20596.1 hypothetical protein [Haloferax litoreum]
MVSLDPAAMVPIVLSIAVVAVVVAATKSVYDELRGGTDTLSLTSVLLLVTGSVVSVGSNVAGLDDEHPLVLGALVVVSLGILLRGVVWVRDRETEAV